VVEVLPTQLIPDDDEGKVLRVKLIMKEGVEHFSPVYLFDEGSTVSWIPCGRKLSCSYPGIKFACYPDVYFGHEVIDAFTDHLCISAHYSLSAGPCVQQDAFD
jgi:phosphoribulokinase